MDMTRHAALCAVAVALASTPAGAASGADGAAVAPAQPLASAVDPGRAMIETLAAAGPHPSLGDEARVFDRFVGSWDCAYSFHLPDGSVRRSAGELEFGWIIDGWALQDIWISYPKDGTTGQRTIGTSVRFFDPKTRVWRVVFVAPTFGLLTTVQGGAEGDRIVLRGQDADGGSLRWSFNDIRADSFVWRGEKSRDGGKTWILEEEHRMKRRGKAASSPRPASTTLRQQLEASTCTGASQVILGGS